MKNNNSFSSEAWLLSGIINSLPGILSLKNNKLIFTAHGTGTFWASRLKKLEKKSGVSNLPSFLKQNKPVQLFNVEVGEIQKLNFPAIYFSTGVNIKLKNEKYRLSFIEPNNTKVRYYDENVEIIQDIRQSIKIGKTWKSLLLKTEER